MISKHKTPYRHLARIFGEKPVRDAGLFLDARQMRILEDVASGCFEVGPSEHIIELRIFEDYFYPDNEPEYIKL